MKEKELEEEIARKKLELKKKEEQLDRKLQVLEMRERDIEMKERDIERREMNLGISEFHCWLQSPYFSGIFGDRCVRQVCRTFLLEKEVSNGPLSGKDPILEMVSIFEYVLDKSNCSTTMGRCTSLSRKPQTQKAGIIGWPPTFASMVGRILTVGRFYFEGVDFHFIIDTRQRVAIYRI